MAVNSEQPHRPHAASPGPNRTSGQEIAPGRAGKPQQPWRKSSWSTFNGNCVEAAGFPGGQVGVRDTKDRGAGPVLYFGAAAWASFLAGVRSGEFTV